jgi:RNA polymerase sigma factor (sigma-70 family)
MVAPQVAPDRDERAPLRTPRGGRTGYHARVDRKTTPASDAYYSDPGLVQACLDGDETAWAELVERYQRLVLSVARRCGLSDDDADDVFQIVFATLFRRLEGLRDQTRLSSWLITTTYREAWRLGRNTERHAPLSEAIVDVGTPPFELVAQAEREQLVREAIGRLDARCRNLLTALFLSGDQPAYDEVARRFGMPVGSIGPTRVRCFKKLAAILDELGVRREA